VLAEARGALTRQALVGVTHAILIPPRLAC